MQIVALSGAFTFTSHQRIWNRNNNMSGLSYHNCLFYLVVKEEKSYDKEKKNPPKLYFITVQCLYLTWIRIIYKAKHSTWQPAFETD